MKNVLVKIVFVLGILAIFGWIISNKISSRHLAVQKEKAETEKRVQIEQNISDMAARHNAVTDWEKTFYKKLDILLKPGILLRQIYTVDIEDTLIRNDNRPVLLFAHVDDITRQGNKYYVYFQDYFDSYDIRFILECNSEQVKKIMNQKCSYKEEYSFVALISSIYRPKFEVGAEISGDDERSYAEVVVESSDILIARGRCLDLLFVGDYEPKGE